MTFAIDEMAPWMWIFIVLLLIVAGVSIVRMVYIWVAEDPCRAYNLVAAYWGRVGDHCVG